MIVLHRVFIISSLVLYCTPFIAMELPKNENRRGLLPHFQLFRSPLHNLCAKEFTRGLISESFGSIYEVNFTHKVLASVMHTWGKKKLKSKMQASQARAALLALSAPAHIAISNFCSIDSGEPNRTYYNAQASLFRKPIKYAFALYKPSKKDLSDFDSTLLSIKLPAALSLLSNNTDEALDSPRFNIKKAPFFYWFGCGIGQIFVKSWVKKFFD